MMNLASSYPLLALRQGRRYPRRAGWTRPYRRWLADLGFPLAPQHIALQEYRDTLDETERRVERLTGQLRQLTPAWRWAPVVDALQALRGVSFVTAVGLVAEVGDIRRFTHPRELMAYLGLVPSEYSSGPSVRRGGITKAGNPHARRLLAEAAWADQGVPRTGRQMLYRQEGLSKSVCDIAWTAQLRLTSRFRKLVARGEAKPQVATAVARELTGFIWAIAREVAPAARVVGRRSGPPGRRHHGQGGEPSETLWTSARSIRPWLGRGSSATNHSLGGTQPADISSVNRRWNAVSPTRRT